MLMDEFLQMLSNFYYCDMQNEESHRSEWVRRFKVAKRDNVNKSDSYEIASQFVLPWEA